MSFVRKAANAVLPFGLLGNALLKKDGDKKDKPQSSLVTEGYNSGPRSMIGSGRNY